MKKQAHTWIDEATAAQMVGFSCREAFRRKVQAKGPYAGQEPLPITFAKIGRNYRYCQQSIEALLSSSSSQLTH